jgi:hypothetical protein
MIFTMGLGVLGVAGLLAVLGTLSGGRLHIENVCDIRRQQKPLTFFGIVMLATLVFGGLLLCGLLTFAPLFMSSS